MIKIWTKLIAKKLWLVKIEILKSNNIRFTKYAIIYLIKNRSEKREVVLYGS